MIYAIAPERGLHGLGDHQKMDGRVVSDFVKVVSYERLFEDGTIPVGAYMFLGLDKLTETETALVSRVRQTLGELSQSIPLFNDPACWVPRGRLLEIAFEEGLNTFQVQRATQSMKLRYPVFVRSESRHTGSLSPLLYRESQVRRAVLAARARGYRTSDLLIVEYCHTADTDGVYHKYSAMAVGPHIVPRSLTLSREWVTKVHGRITDIRAAEAELEYVTRNPHENWLRRVLELGGVEYGRVDYGVLDGRPQLWEINTNPTVSAFLGRPMMGAWGEEALRRLAPARELFNEQFHEALRAVEHTGTSALEAGAVPHESIEIAVSAELRARLKRERGRRDRRLLVPLRRAFRALRRGTDRLGLTRP